MERWRCRTHEEGFSHQVCYRPSLPCLHHHRSLLAEWEGSAGVGAASCGGRDCMPRTRNHGYARMCRNTYSPGCCTARVQLVHGSRVCRWGECGSGQEAGGGGVVMTRTVMAGLQQNERSIIDEQGFPPRILQEGRVGDQREGKFCLDGRVSEAG